MRYLGLLAVVAIALMGSRLTSATVQGGLTVAGEVVVQTDKQAYERGQLIRITVTAPPKARCRTFYHFESPDQTSAGFGSRIVPASGKFSLSRPVPLTARDGDGLIVVHCGPRLFGLTPGVEPGMGYAEIVVSGPPLNGAP